VPRGGPPIRAQASAAHTREDLTFAVKAHAESKSELSSSRRSLVTPRGRERADALSLSECGDGT
jgi:hypothetical protein